MDVFTRVAVMDAFFASVAESFDKLGRDIAATFDRVGVDYNRSTSAAQRAETAAKTGIVSEHDAGLSSLPSYVVELGARARVVDVSANAVAALPENLGALVKAHKLNAARNALVSLPESLCSMASLRVLRLEGNRLESLPARLGDLARLEELSLGDNRIAALPASVASLRKLSRLDLSRNRFVTFGDDDGADPSGLAHLAGCASLTEIRLDGNVDVATLPAEWGGLTRLRSLSCDGAGVREVPGRLLAGCEALDALSLRGCPIDVEAFKETEGYDAFEARRRKFRDKQIESGVMLGRGGLDDGLDHPA